MRRLGLLLLTLLLLASLAWATPGFDSANGNSCTNCTSLSVNVTVGSAANRLLVGQACYTGLSLSVSSFTIGGTGATNIITTPEYNNINTTAYYKIAPSTGVNAIAITTSATASEIIVGGMALSGAAQTSPVRDSDFVSSAAAFPVTPSLTSSATDLLVDLLCVFTDSTNTGAGQTERWANTTTNMHGYASTKPSAGATDTMTWETSGANSSTLHALSILEAVAASGRRRTILVTPTP